MYKLLIDPEGQIRELTFTEGELFAKIMTKHLYLGFIIHNYFKYLLMAPLSSRLRELRLREVK